VVVENEKIRASTAEVLKPIVFTRRNDLGRAGFYLKSVLPLEPADSTDAD
jgi:predicted nucleotidyltransferase